MGQIDDFIAALRRNSIAPAFVDGAASAVSIVEAAGLHRCPHTDLPTYCGCAPDRCADRTKRGKMPR